MEGFERFARLRKLFDVCGRLRNLSPFILIQKPPGWRKAIFDPANPSGHEKTVPTLHNFGPHSLIPQSRIPHPTSPIGHPQCC
jgi:hypothetical protein